MLEFQARAVIQLYRGGILRYSRDIVQLDSWAEMIVKLRNLDTSCKDHVSALSMQDQSFSLSEIQKQLAEAMEDFRADTKSKLSSKLKLCHQAFEYDYSKQKDLNSIRTKGEH